MNRMRQFFRPYKRNYSLRVGNVLIISVVLWFAIGGGIEDVFWPPILVGYMEYITMNMLYEMDFPPFEKYARRSFGDKDSYGYKAFFVMVYLIFWFMLIITLIEEL